MPRPAWLKPLWEPTQISIGGLATLTNYGTSFIILACARVDFTNVASLEFGGFVNKIGTGTQSWQLWNVTDGAELAVINDAGAAGEKALTPVTVSSGLPTGLKTVQLRAKSTVAADDPIFRGAYLLLQ